MNLMSNFWMIIIKNMREKIKNMNLVLCLLESFC